MLFLGYSFSINYTYLINESIKVTSVGSKKDFGIIFNTF